MYLSPPRHRLGLARCAAVVSSGLGGVAQKTALLTFRAPSSHAEINDVQWCPWRASMFAAVTAGGKVELWDIALSVLMPVAIYQREGDPRHSHESATGQPVHAWQSPTVKLQTNFDDWLIP